MARDDDPGTPEAMARKIAIVGPHGDPVLAEYPLGCLLARQIISQDMHNAGMRYSELAGKVLGRTKPKRAGVGRFSELSDHAEQVVERRWREGCEVLINAGGRACKYEVDDVVVYERWPTWLVNSGQIPPVRQLKRAGGLLITGLTALSDWIAG
jgi:hypothetical protein